MMKTNNATAAIDDLLPCRIFIYGNSVTEMLATIPLKTQVYYVIHLLMFYSQKKHYHRNTTT